MKKFHSITILAKDKNTEIWLSNKSGSLVSKEEGELNTKILKGEYVVSFGSNKDTYPVVLESNMKLNQDDITKIHPCERPIFNLAERFRTVQIQKE